VTPAPARTSLSGRIGVGPWRLNPWLDRQVLSVLAVIGIVTSSTSKISDPNVSAIGAITKQKDARNDPEVGQQPGIVMLAIFIEDFWFMQAPYHCGLFRLG
jgi:hypothetical protein